MIRTHDGSHGPDCYGCKIQSITIAPSAMPTRNGGQTAVDTNARDARWARDMPAYKRLRRDGLQPPTIDGSARLEQELT